MAGGNYSINQGSCQKCGKCVPVCPHGAIQHIGDQFWIDHNLCNGCGICKTVCPYFAISFTPDSQSNLGHGGPTGI